MDFNPFENKKRAFAIFTVLSVLFFLVWMGWDTVATDKPLPVFRTGDILEHRYNNLLLIRRTSSNGNLLLKILNEDSIYYFDFAANQVSKVDKSIWDQSIEKVAICDHSISIYPRKNSKYDPYGKYALSAAESPSKEKVAVLSAYGPQGPAGGLIFGGGEGRIFGTRYLEIKENSGSFRTIGRPRRLRNSDEPSLCWSADENLLIIYDSSLHFFSVLNLGPTPTPEEARQVVTVPTSMPDLSRLTGAVRDYGIDEDGDGRFDKIAVEVETETAVPGEYTIRVSLRSDNGKHFYAGTETELKGGVETTKLYFDANEWFEEKIDNSLTYSLIDLDYRIGLPLDRREELKRTDVYKISQFRRPSILYTGENTVTPIDVDKNGKFEGLEIKVGVNVIYPGEYDFQGDLYDESSMSTAEGNIDFYKGKTRLNQGDNVITFFFKGKNIIDRDKSGKYRLRFVTLSAPGRNGPFIDVLLTTDPYHVSQFEAAN